MVMLVMIYRGVKNSGRGVWCKSTCGGAFMCTNDVINYPHMPIDMLGIYWLLFFCFLFVVLFVCRILVTDISGVG